MSETSIAIITARGGSKRIPKKNIKDFCGKPIIAYSITAALDSQLFKDVMVSTDSEEIANIARDYGASVPFLRAAGVSGDFATTADVIQSVLDEYAKHGTTFDWFCCLYPTAPFITVATLKDAYHKMCKAGADSLIPIAAYSYPPQRSLVMRQDRVEYQYPQYERTRSQDLEPLYHDCGQFYFCRTAAFQASHSLVTKNNAAYVIPEKAVQDIDYPDDWELAELKYRKYILHEE